MSGVRSSSGNAATARRTASARSCPCTQSLGVGTRPGGESRKPWLVWSSSASSETSGWRKRKQYRDFTRFRRWCRPGPTKRAQSSAECSGKNGRLSTQVVEHKNKTSRELANFCDAGSMWHEVRENRDNLVFH